MTTEWQFDMQHSAISFTVRHLLVSKVRGRFPRWTGTMRFDPDDPAGSFVQVKIDASSVDTGQPQRDGHLRSADFLDVERFPALTFVSTKVLRRDAQSYAVEGNLTIRGVTRVVILDVEYGGSLRDPWGKERTGFSAKTSIDRKEYGVSFNQVLDHGGLALGEKVAIEIDIEATRVARTAAA
jgi:polyisoprenoid-binding protein YceI